MRVLKTLFFSLFWLSILGGGGFLVSREVLLQIGISKLTSDAGRLQSIYRNTGSYIQDCQAKGSTSIDGTIISAIQLRFTSSTEYLIEVICSQYSIDPIVVEEFELPRFVTKVPGSSGFVWGFEPTAVTLELWGRKRSVGIVEQKIVLGVSPDEVGTTFSPTTSCAGFGYTCCQPETSVGEGEQVTIATDCPRTCHTSCGARPVVLSVTTQPFLDQATRTLTVSRGSEVSVGYVVDRQMLEDVITTIDYGDGEKEQFTEISGFNAHTYNCSAASCRYTILVSAIDGNGVSSADTPITKVTVIVQ